MRGSSRCLVLVTLIATDAGAAELGILSERTAHEGAVRSLAAAGPLLLSGGEDGAAIVWNGDKEIARLTEILPKASVAKGEATAPHAPGERYDPEVEKDQADAETNKLFAVALTADGKRAVTGGLDMKLRVYELPSGRLLAVLEGHTRPILALAVSPDGTTVASGSSDSEIRLWNLGKLDAAARVLAGDEDWVQAVGFSADGGGLASGSEDGVLKLRNARSGEVVGSWKAGTAGVSALHWLDGTSLVAGDKSGAVSLYDASLRKKLAALGSHSDAVADLDVSADGRLVATASFDGTLRVWDAQKAGIEQARWTLDAAKDAPRSVAFAPDGSLTAGTLSGRLVHLTIPGP